MKKGRKYTEEEIAVICKSLIGKTMKDYSNSELTTIGEDDNKGGFGQLIERLVFGIDNNSESEPDFMPAGIELKVTPYKKLQNNQLSAKERLALNVIDYETEYKNEFKSSYFWFKNNTIQLLWYLWEDNKKLEDCIITHAKLLKLIDNEDLNQIEEDWNTIIKKIKEGKAHEISEADTMYLGAFTKGKDSNSLRKQPFSNIMAKQRAFCFKKPYMTQLVRKYIGSYEDVEKVITDSRKTFREYVNDIVKKYRNKSQKELMELFNIDSSAKNINDLIVRNMFGVRGILSKTDEFLKANIVPRTVRMESNGKIKESMPFPAFKYKDLVKEEWEESEFRSILENTKYMFFVFKKTGNDYVFKGIKLWNMPEMVIDSNAKEMWNRTVEVIKEGNIVKEVLPNGTRITNFPGMSENEVCHVRPHALNSRDTFELPVADQLTGAKEYTKHCFWINSKYLEELLSEFIN